MPIAVDVYRLDATVPVPLEAGGIDQELRLQEILASKIEIVDPDLLIIGREVRTSWDSRIDILAIDPVGQLVVVELKRNRTPREVVSQVLEYGCWIKDLDNTAVAEVYQRYLENYFPKEVKRSLDEAFKARFGIEIPDELNTDHRLLIVAAELDAGTERIVEYLTVRYAVPINAVFFRVFKDNGREYLTRAWLRQPDEETEIVPARESGEWNGEYYANFGHGSDRSWDIAREYGFISAGGGKHYTSPLNLLAEGGRVWVNAPGFGYVGVGIVSGPPVRINQMMCDGRPFRELPKGTSYGLKPG